MKRLKSKNLIVGLIVFVVAVGTLYSENVVKAFDQVFSVSVDGDVVRSRGRFRVRRNGVTRFRTRGAYVRGDDFGSCASSGSDYGSCDNSNRGSDYSGCDQGFMYW